MLYHYHEWVPHVEDMPDHVPHHVRHRYRAERCVRCDAVRWLRDDYRPPAAHIDGHCFDDTDKHTDTEGQ